MAGRKTVIQLEYDLNVESLLKEIDKLMKRVRKPDLVYVKLSSAWFPRRALDFPPELTKLFCSNPRVKPAWDVFPNIAVRGDAIDNPGDPMTSWIAQTDGTWLKQAYKYLTSDKTHRFFKIIIPCWGVKDEVGEMLDSILEQTFEDYHIVCVDDCSNDGTLDVLKLYCERHPDKITLIQNEKNVGAGESRNIGHYQTLFSIPSDYEWVVDADDYLADKHVLQKIHDFAIQNPKLDVINIGWTCKGTYYVSRLGWPVGLPGRVIRPSVYVPGLGKNIPMGNDVYSHFVMFDTVPGDKIGYLDYNCYVYPKAGRHINDSIKSMDVPREIGMGLMSHRFQKQIVIDEIM